MSDSAVLRTSLVEQLHHLIDEVEASRNVLGDVPDEVLERRPRAEDRTVKELYASIAALDMDILLPWLGGESENLTPATGQSIGHILSRVQMARRLLLRHVESIPTERWDCMAPLEGRPTDLYGALHMITQRNADTLRAIAHRLYRSR